MSPRTNMKFQTYTSTPGLERYPQRERFAAWRALHKQLLKDDPQYRKRFHAYLSSNICLACILGAGCLGAPRGIVGLVLYLFVTLCLVATIVYLAFRQQHFMNQSIGRLMQSSHE
jgi:hypothetical protein